MSKSMTVLFFSDLRAYAYVFYWKRREREAQIRRQAAGTGPYLSLTNPPSPTTGQR